MRLNAQRILLPLAVALWLPVSSATSTRPGISFCPSCPDNNEDYGTDSVSTATAAPSATPPYVEDSSSQSTNWNVDASDGIDFLVAAFFLIAAGWLVLALVYSVLVLLVVRLRARGQLDVYDETFGRFYLFGTRCYIPLGCVLRRYVIAMDRDRQGDHATVRVMSREERRSAMEKLLVADEEGGTTPECVSNTADSNDEKVPTADAAGGQLPDATDEEQQVPDDASTEEAVCTICLGEYGKYMHFVLRAHS